MLIEAPSLNNLPDRIKNIGKGVFKVDRELTVCTVPIISTILFIFSIFSC